MSALTRPPARIPLAGPDGLITREWYRYFDEVSVRLGAASGSGTDDLTTSAFEDAGIEETKAGLYALRDEIMAAPVATPLGYGYEIGAAPQYEPISPQDELMADLHSLRAEVDLLRQQVRDLQQSTSI